MMCPSCQARATCVDSRAEVEWRRRRWVCPDCGERFTSAEFIVWTGDGKGKNVVTDWLEKIRQQGATDLVAKLDALINPWRRREVTEEIAEPRPPSSSDTARHSHLAE